MKLFPILSRTIARRVLNPQRSVNNTQSNGLHATRQWKRKRISPRDVHGDTADIVQLRQQRLLSNKMLLAHAANIILKRKKKPWKRADRVPDPCHIMLVYIGFIKMARVTFEIIRIKRTCITRVLRSV